MNEDKLFDIIIVGGSYAGLAAAMALGRSLRKVLVIDGGMPCNRQTPHSHNFITHDGRKPAEIAALAKEQVMQYNRVSFVNDLVLSGKKMKTGFELQTSSDDQFFAQKLVFATGIRDIMPDIPGYAECWGISVLHCPYCHGYEVRHTKTGIVGNGDFGFEFATLLSNWARDLVLLTNGKSVLSPWQRATLQERGIETVETEIKALRHNGGHLQEIVFSDDTAAALKTLYVKSPFVQHCAVPELLGCELTSDGYIAVDGFQRTSIPGIFACGDNASRMRTVANAVGSGTTAGMMANKEFVLERFTVSDFA